MIPPCKLRPGRDVELVVHDERRKLKLVRRDVCFVEVEVTSYRPSEVRWAMADWYRQLFQIAAGGDSLFEVKFLDDPRDFLLASNHTGHIHQVDKQFYRIPRGWTAPECGWGTVKPPPVSNSRSPDSRAPAQ